jgi:hypothetical protein
MSLVISMGYFHSALDEDSKLLASAGLPVFTFLLTQPTAFSLSTLFTLSKARILVLFAKAAFGMSPPEPLGELAERNWTFVPC